MNQQATTDESVDELAQLALAAHCSFNLRAKFIFEVSNVSNVSGKYHQ